MSRTDSTDPHYVRAQWWEPNHWRCQYTSYPSRVCDLPAEPVVSYRGPVSWRSGMVLSCGWGPAWEGVWGRGVPHWFNRAYYTCSERRRVRDQLIRARAEHRGTGEVDVICETAQHRHAGRWLYW